MIKEICGVVALWLFILLSSENNIAARLIFNSCIKLQIMFCYAANGKSSSPSHLWLTGCGDDMETQLLKIPGYENWIIEKERLSYIEIFKERKDDLVYMTPDAETVLDDIDPKKLYILGGLVDRTRQKGVTIKKARSQRIQTAKLPIQEYLKESSCKVSSPHFNISSFLCT